MSFKRPKLIVALTINFLFLLPIYAQKKTDREEAGLIGLVKTIRVESSFFINLFGEFKETNTNRESFTSYDRNGNITAQSIFKGYDELVIANRTLTKMDDLVTKGVYSYDSDGKLTAIVWVNSAGVPVGKDVYGDSGRLATRLHYSSDGVMRKEQTYAYDPSGNQISEADCNFRGSRLIECNGKTLFSYDEAGNIKERAFYNEDGSKALHPLLGAHRVSLLYHPNGKLAAQLLYDRRGSVIRRNEFLYNSQGNMAEQAIYRKKDDRKPTRYSYTYELDSFGNWVKKITSKVLTQKNKTVTEPDSVTYRFLSYY